MITRRRATELLLTTNDSVVSLPRVEIRAGQRIAEQLAETAKQTLGIEAYTLFVSRTPAAPENALGTKCALLESLEQNDAAPTGTSWVSSAGATVDASMPSGDCAAIRGTLQELERDAAEPVSAPFARPGWIKELSDWIQEQLDPLGLRMTGRFQQLNAGRKFSLVRIETCGPAVWFKATGEPNIHEVPVTVTLARLFPSYVPELLGLHSSWNGWLSREASGSTLDNFSDVAAWKRVAKKLAELQIASIAKSTELLESGCKEIGLSKLIEEVDPFLVRMSALMAMQEEQPPAILTKSQLQILGEELKNACSELQYIRLPHTLGHFDFNPGNILVSPETCIFLDWAEASVTLPLITFEYLREHHRRLHPGDEKAVEKIKSAYLDAWLPFFSLDDLASGLAVTPLVAVYAYAISGSGWRSSEALQNPALAGYLRGLTRRMHREAVRIRERSEPCLR
jgi:hypothetical protein